MGTQGMAKRMSRRELVCAGGAAVSLAAVSHTGRAEATEAISYADTIPWDTQYDVAVVGWGGAGSVAAITAAEEGAKVLLLEKAPEGHEGGNTRYCEQAFCIPIRMTMALPSLRLCRRALTRRQRQR